jgi:hypothetical protein
MRINERIKPYTRAALEAGFRVYAPVERYAHQEIGHVYAFLDPEGPAAILQVPTMNLDPVDVTAPIKPSREYGSSVMVDHDGTIPGVLEALRKTCESRTVAVRFMPRSVGTPIVPNHGRKTFYCETVELTAQDLEG